MASVEINALVHKPLRRSDFYYFTQLRTAERAMGADICSKLHIRALFHLTMYSFEIDSLEHFS